MSSSSQNTTAPLTERVTAIITDNPSIMVRSIAADLGVSEKAVTEALPPHMRLEIPAADFVAVWEEMTGWEKVMFIGETPGAVVEIAGQLPKGKMAHGMYNLMSKKFALGGHLLIDNIASIWLVSKPAFGLESHSVQFFSLEGKPCFAVYLGRGEKRMILASVKQAYLQLWEKYATSGATC